MVDSPLIAAACAWRYPEVSGGGEAAVVRVGGDGVQEGVGGGVELRRGASHLLVIWEVWSRVGWGLIA
uniref:Uncharacterized protein n=1 Tax=Oryza sativa subsp. japonica TaxID=39947 RepID=Q6Z3N4_ORYSJ|nr:hypothetical protein [Oryza sativa Japonica Group]BAD05562.1 hypothetical protein [Oryza sativa Japonica Group]